MAGNGTQRDIANTPLAEEFLTVEQVRKLLQVGRTFAYYLVKSGELPSYRVGRLRRIRRRDVEEWLEENRCVTSE